MVRSSHQRYVVQHWISGIWKKKHLVGMMIGITIRLAFDNEGSRVSTHHEEGEFGVKALVKSCKVTWWQENSLMRPSDDICFGTVAILNLRQMPSRCTLGTSCACFQKIPCTSAPNAQMTKNNFRIRCNRITCRFKWVPSCCAKTLTSGKAGQSDLLLFTFW